MFLSFVHCFSSTYVHNPWSQLLFTTYVHNSCSDNNSQLLFTALDPIFLSQIFSQTFIYTFFSQLLLINFVHKFCSQLLFTTLDQNCCSQLFLTFGSNTSVHYFCSKLSLIAFIYNFWLIFFVAIDQNLFTFLDHCFHIFVFIAKLTLKFPP